MWPVLEMEEVSCRQIPLRKQSLVVVVDHE
jgi:hypothetical protein